MGTAWAGPGWGQADRALGLGPPASLCDLEPMGWPALVLSFPGLSEGIKDNRGIPKWVRDFHTDARRAAQSFHGVITPVGTQLSTASLEI